MAVVRMRMPTRELVVLGVLAAVYLLLLAASFLRR
jgi:hypothetical protein